MPASWVASALGRVTVIDVRNPNDYSGPLGHIVNAELIPLLTLTQAIDDWESDKEIVLVCETGARSECACQILQALGHTRVASMNGGMVQWHAEALDTCHHIQEVA